MMMVMVVVVMMKGKHEDGVIANNTPRSSSSHRFQNKVTRSRAATRNDDVTRDVMQREAVPLPSLSATWSQ